MSLELEPIRDRAERANDGDLFRLIAEVERLRKVNSDCLFLLGKYSKWSGTDLGDACDSYGIDLGDLS